MSLLRVIRRWYFRDELSQREIAKRTGISRNTIRKYINNQDVEPKYPCRKSIKKLDEYTELLSIWLAREAKRRRKQRKTVKQLYQELIKLGYTGSYDRVAAFARDWRQLQKDAASHKGTYVPLAFEPGEAFQFDWGEHWLHVGGRSMKLQLAHFKLCYSRASYIRAYLTQTHEMLFDAHKQAFRVFGGVPERGIYDNMKTAVDKVAKGKKRYVNRRFEAMASHYLFDTDFCNTASGWEKGQVERLVRSGRDELLNKAPRFATLDELNEWLEARCIQLWSQTKHPEYPGEVERYWRQERQKLMKITAPFDGFIEQRKKVSSTCLVTFERSRYSVPASFANRTVSLRIYPDKLEFIAEERCIATHQRSFVRDHGVRGKTHYDWRHYLLVAQRKPGSLRNGAPFKEMPDGFRELQRQLMKREGGDREMVDILALVLHYDEQVVEEAINQSLRTGYTSKQHVMNCLGRLSDRPHPEPAHIDTHLRLTVEPEANTQRYDQLQGGRRAH